MFIVEFPPLGKFQGQTSVRHCPVTLGYVFHDFTVGPRPRIVNIDGSDALSNIPLMPRNLCFSIIEDGLGMKVFHVITTPFNYYCVCFDCKHHTLANRSARGQEMIAKFLARHLSGNRSPRLRLANVGSLILTNL